MRPGPAHLEARRKRLDLPEVAPERLDKGTAEETNPPKEGPFPAAREEGARSRPAYGRGPLRVTEPDLGSYTGKYGSPNVPVY
jgi:hypothetical protein